MPEHLISGSILDEQIELETKAVKDGVARYRRLANQAIERGDGASLKPAERMVIFWMDAMRMAIDAERGRIMGGDSNHGRSVYGAVLMMLDTDRAAFLTLHDLLSNAMEHPPGLKYTKALYSVGRAFLAEINYDKISKEWDVLRGLTKRCRRLNPVKINWWAKRELDDPVWERSVVIKLGDWLVHTACSVCAVNEYTGVNDFRPAFHVANRWVSKNKLTKFITMSDELTQIIEDGHSLRQFLRPKYLPMLVQPMPWSDDTEGGYVRIRTPYTTKPTPEQKKAMSGPRASRTRLNKALNSLNATPWRINRVVYETMLELWESGGGIAELPSRTDLPYPPKLPEEADSQARDIRKQQAREIHKKNHATRSARRQIESVLHVASMFIDKDHFYLPHQFDFRYRAMPIPQPLNHHASDPVRAMLEYAEGRTPGTDYHLKVQMAGFCGMDKVSFDDRVRWCDDTMETIQGWAEAPLENTGWMLMDKPWQALASAVSLVDEDAAAHIVFRTDGSCNALQHYAAIGRDYEAAGLVNLLPSDAPSDVYMDVLARVRQKVEADAGTTDKSFTIHDTTMSVAELADAIIPALSRSVVKQTAMTTMYDVTDVGAKRQIRGQLKKAGLHDEKLWLASKYLAKIVVGCAIQSVGAAGPIMAWLRESARKIAKTGQLVTWTTPLEMPVVQPYVLPKMIKSNGTNSQILRTGKGNKVSVGRQRRGCPPNYIHSIDSTHMLMSCSECVDADIHFSAIHDSFGSHAADAERTGVILREQFIALHELPLLEALYMEWSENYPKAKIDAPPDFNGSLDLSLIAEAQYAFA